jgi:L-amino acid N-acyltransferase YncA
VPTLLVSATDIQQELAGAVHSYGAHRWLGDVAALDTTAVTRELDTIANNQPHRIEMSRLGSSLIDGAGASRVAAALAAPDDDWQIRPAAREDIEAVWEIATGRAVLAPAFSDETSTFPQYERSWCSLIDQGDSRLWVASRHRAVAGFVRYDPAKPAAAVTFGVTDSSTGHGLGARLLEETWQEACRALGVSSVRGVAFTSNESSQRAFLEAGFNKAGETTESGRSCVVFERTRGSLR